MTFIEQVAKNKSKSLRKFQMERKDEARQSLLSFQSQQVQI